MAFEMKCTGGPYGDSLCTYDVILDREYTIEEFVEEVQKEKQNEWGTITIAKDLKHAFSSKIDDCEYKGGKITRNFSSHENKKKKIREVKAHGGWSLMDYFIKPKE